MWLGGFRDKTLGDGFKLSVCFIACGVLEQHKDVSRCCVVMSHTGHPLTLYTSAGGGWHGKHILPGARPGTLLGLEHFCLPLSSPAWCWRCCAEMAAGGSPEPSEVLAAWFWKNTLPERFSCGILLLRVVCIWTHITTNGHRKSEDILSEKYMDFFELPIPWDFRVLWPKEDGIFSFQSTDSHNTCSSPSLKPKPLPTSFLCLSLPTAPTDRAAAYLSQNCKICAFTHWRRHLKQ